MCGAIKDLLCSELGFFLPGDWDCDFESVICPSIDQGSKDSSFFSGWGLSGILEAQ